LKCDVDIAKASFDVGGVIKDVFHAVKDCRNATDDRIVV